jgi:hypothetical protein
MDPLAGSVPHIPRDLRADRFSVLRFGSADFGLTGYRPFHSWVQEEPEGGGKGQLVDMPRPFKKEGKNFSRF